MTESFYSPVIQIDVADFQPSLQGIRVDSIAMVLSDDVHSVRLDIAYRVIATAMPKLQFERPGSERLADKLFP
jgi:hypothetical protein